ncbi:hypothetical protein BDY21DRAFT_342777 [Lineolata rhizophorae]|uniref:Uncharacterized protein n=1 Tax=Lineolata rhizophorae TaxID=578093 RepID=A0A6A6P1B5_9PEZI|nr:hypothetical protein BDY21DRAFT_342777 [Lineolata rhizophorae]
MFPSPVPGHTARRYRHRLAARRWADASAPQQQIIVIAVRRLAIRIGFLSLAGDGQGNGGATSVSHRCRSSFPGCPSTTAHTPTGPSARTSSRLPHLVSDWRQPRT